MFRILSIIVAITTVVTFAIFGLHQLRGFDSLLDQIYVRIMGWLAPGGSVGRSLMQPAIYGTIGGLAALSAWIVLTVPRLRQRVILIACLVIVIIGASATLGLYAILFDPISALLAVVLASIIAFCFSTTSRGQKRLALREVVGGRVSSAGFEKLCASSTAIASDAGEREVTVLTVRVFFRDVVTEEQPVVPQEGGEETKAEEKEIGPEPDHHTASATDVGNQIELTNECLLDASDFLLGRDAYLDNASADCIRVFFGLSGHEENHALSACRAALDLDDRLRRKFGNAAAIDYGIAMNTGVMRVGVFQAGSVRYFTGVGSDVDFTRRLCVANLTYGTRILIGAGTHQKIADDMEVRPIDMLYVPEAEVMFEVCELIAPAGVLNEEQLARRDAFWKGVISYREGDHASAAAHFAEADSGTGDDLPLNYYRAKVEDDFRESNGADDQEGRRKSRSHARLANTI